MSDPVIAPVHIPFWLWARAIFDLRRKGGGRRESGAFLLGRPGARAARVSDYLCYDEIDPNAYQGGVIAFHDTGYGALWDHCKSKRLEVLADIHTHGGDDVGQSSVDKRHPMMPLVGHTAMIVPHFAKMAWWSLKAVGVYEYLGNFEWRTHGFSDGPQRVKLKLW